MDIIIAKRDKGTHPSRGVDQVEDQAPWQVTSKKKSSNRRQPWTNILA
jgi:hypothetical protein